MTVVPNHSLSIYLHLVEKIISAEGIRVVLENKDTNNIQCNQIDNTLFFHWSLELAMDIYQNISLLATLAHAIHWVVNVYVRNRTIFTTYLYLNPKPYGEPKSNGARPSAVTALTWYTVYMVSRTWIPWVIAYFKKRFLSSWWYLLFKMTYPVWQNFCLSNG